MLRRSMMTTMAMLWSWTALAQQPANCPLGGAIVAPDNTVWVCRGTAQTPLQVSTGGGESVPAGAILLIDSGSCPTGYAEVAGLDGKTILGTLNAHGNVGGTGGSDTITPAGTNTAPSFTGTAWSAPAVSWPAGVPTFAGNAFSSVINHTHTVTVTDPGHTHVERIINSGTAGTVGVQGASAASNANASNSPTASATTGITATTANPAGGVASITPAGTISWPAGVPTIGAYTPTGSVSAPTFTGTQFDNRSAFVRMIACKKT